MSPLNTHFDLFNIELSRHSSICILLSISFLTFCNCSKYIANLYFITDLNCSIHNVKLETKLCKIRYGLYHPIEYLYTPGDYQKKVHYDSLFCEELTNEFPEAYTNNYVLGGCGEYSQKFSRIQYCPVCNANKRRWLKENRHLKPFPNYDVRTQFTGCRPPSNSKKNFDSLFFSSQPFGNFSKDLVFKGFKPVTIYVKKNLVSKTIDSVVITNDSAHFFHRVSHNNVNKKVRISGHFYLFIIDNLLLNVRRGTYHDPDAPEEYIIEINNHGKYIGCNDCLSVIGYEKRQIRKVNWLITRLIEKHLVDWILPDNNSEEQPSKTEDN